MTYECCAFILLNSALSMHCGLLGMDQLLKDKGGTDASSSTADKVPYYHRIIVTNKYILAILVIFAVNAFSVYRTSYRLFEVLLFPLTLVMLCCLFLPYLKSPSPLLARKYDIVDREVSTTRRWHHYLVWSNVVYLMSAMYSFSCQQYVFGASQIATGICSTLYHLHKESCYFNLDNIFATMFLFAFLYSWLCSYEINMIFFFFGMLGMPVAAFVIISCGLPADIVRQNVGSVDNNGNGAGTSALGGTEGIVNDNFAINEDRLPSVAAEIGEEAVELLLASPRMRTRSSTKKLVGTSTATNGSTSTTGTTADAAAVLALRAMSTSEIGSPLRATPSSTTALRGKMLLQPPAEDIVSACCLDITVVTRNPRPFYDTVHAVWHLVSALGPVQCTWFARQYVLTGGANNEAVLGVLGAGFLDSTKLFPTLPVVSIGLSVLLNIFLNYFEFGPFE